MAASEHMNKTLTKEIRNLKLKQYIPFSVKLNACITEHLSYIAEPSTEAAPKQSQPKFLLGLT